MLLFKNYIIENCLKIKNWKLEITCPLYYNMKKIQTQKHYEEFNPKKIKAGYAIVFLLGFSSALTIYIISSFFQQVSGISNLGFFYIIIYILALIVLLNLHKFIRKFGKSAVFFMSLLVLTSSAMLLAVLPTIWISIFILIINLIFYTLCLVELDVILESYSTDKKSGRIRGLHLTIMNTGFILGPLISTQLLRAYNFQAVFFAQFVVIFFALIIALFNFNRINHKFKPIITASAIFKKILKRKNVIRIYYISLILEFFYFIMTVYMPIYLRNQGMDWKAIGIVFSFMLIPFVLLQYPAGFVADKKIGEKELIIASLLIMASATFSLYFIYSINIYIWAIILFITRIGAAMLEVLRDSYFYKQIDGSDVDIINFFRTSRPAGFIIASAISSILILFFPLKSVFILMAFIALSGLIPTFYLVDDKGEEEV